MAIIKKDYKNGREDDRNDLRLEIHSLEHSRTFTFRVRRNRVEVECENKSKNPRKPDEPNYNDWRNALREKDKLRVFALILDEYRKHSIGDEHGYRGAVLGIAEDGQIYLGANTPTGQITSSYFKECAEQNMVSAAADLVAYKQVKAKGWDQFALPQAPKFSEIYMMGGVSQMQVPISCPCGKCTDMLAKNMAKDGKVYTLPILNQETFDYLNATGKNNGTVDITIDRSETLATVRDQVTRKEPDSNALTPYPVWQTDIHHLNADRIISLTEDRQHIANIQKEAYAKFCAQAKNPTNLREEKLAQQHTRALKASRANSPLQLFEMAMQSLFDSTKKLNTKVKEILRLDSPNNALSMAAANQFIGRRSIAELDAASAGGAANLQAINEFMISEIRHTLTDRMLDDPEATAGRKWVRTNVPQVRCVVLQLDDGTFHHAVECIGKYDASLPNAEAAAVVQALPSLGHQGIRDVWVMEMNGEAIKDGVLMTSPKEGVERISKRASTKKRDSKNEESLQFHFIPLNEGGLNSQTLEKIVETKDVSKLMPTLFKGSRPLENVAATRHRSWSDFLSQQVTSTGQGMAHA